ncbi:hypothetical protein NLX83_09490 [Allokutzneria sp. A3M-2-11 16]|uniref:DUF6049 family protein n=1 Tax=Allokutzneria sp. A3M-2-11 16 TaxID=2962043 RepID=UPI0020B6F096|nr:DUF6049 family protein [Allokutzneria sp. A3M-2-11 16]MCP3799489.1 hypothetical protein [Allokutzneria sp. A3M-2-11 16]
MKRLLAALGVAVFLLGTTPLAHAQRGTGDNGADVPKHGRLDLDAITPRVVTAETTEIRVTGKLTNISDRKVSRIEARVQVGQALASDDKAHAALTGTVATDQSSRWSRVADVLDPGQSARVDFVVPLDVLRITAPGVYPLLVNLNGYPEYGGQARIAENRMLLPVLGTPGGAATPAAPATITMIWPIMDRPHLLPVFDALRDKRRVLRDDELAKALQPGGRLSNLVEAVEEAAPKSSPVGNSLCFAIDPDLIDTVSAMTENYAVRSGTRIVDRSPSAAAKQWLDRLKDVVQGRCVLTLPFADVDLVALSRAGLTDLEKLAREKDSLVTEALNAVPVQHVAWPADGVLDARALADLDETVVVMDQRGLQQNPPASQPVRVTAAKQGVQTGPSVLIADPIVNTAFERAGQSGSLRMQNALAAIAYRAGAVGKTGGSVLVTPPRQWTESAEELTALLRATAQLVDGERLAKPKRLTDLAAVFNPGRTVPLNYPPPGGAREISPELTNRVLEARNTVRDMLNYMEEDPARKIRPSALTDPLQLGLLRAMSSAWRTDPVGGEAANAEVTEQVTALTSQVDVVEPPTSYALASSSSPLPLTLLNNLPVAMKVRLNFSDTPGLRTEPLEEKLAPGGGRQIKVNAEVNRSGQFTVTAWLTTPKGGLQLGQPKRLTLRSAAYGSVTLGITLTAGLLMVGMMGMRVYKRLRYGPTMKKPVEDMNERLPQSEGT